MEKTLGGDRLGSGSKMKVHLHGYERSTHDLGFIWRSTMSAGTLVPFLSIVALPGDTFDINLDIDVKTHPTIGPLFGSYKVQADVFSIPIRLYNAALHNNALNIGRNMSQIKLPQLHLLQEDTSESYDVSNSQVNPSCLLAYLGIRGVGMGNAGETGRYFNAVPYLCYWDIYKNYYANKQEEIGMFIHTPQDPLVETVDDIQIDNTVLDEAPTNTLIELHNGSIIEINYTGPGAPMSNQIYIQTQYRGWVLLSNLANLQSDSGTQQIYSYNFAQYGLQYAINWRYLAVTDPRDVSPVLNTFPLTNIDDMRMTILGAYSLTTPVIIDGNTPEPYGAILEGTGEFYARMSSQEGLAIKTYQSDLFNNWLNTAWIDEVNVASAVDVSGGSFTMDQLNLSKKIYDMLNRINVSGGTYDDWLDAVYTHDRITRAETPIYLGGLSKELVFQEVVSNSATTGETGQQPLGTLAGKGVMAKKHKGGHIIAKIDEPSYVMGIVSLTPRIDYSQGNSWDTGLQTIDDLHKPVFDQIGFQDLDMEQLAWFSTVFGGGVWAKRSAGKQPAWINYQTAVNKTYGNFAIENNEMFMTLNRRYAFDGGQGILDLTTYIDPTLFNNIFAQTALDSQNFWVQMAIDITARRKMSAKVMPNL